MSVTIEVPIPEELVPTLEIRARSVGLNREQYISALLSRELSSPAGIDQNLAEFREQVKTSGISDIELTDLFATSRDEVYTSRKK